MPSIRLALRQEAEEIRALVERGYRGEAARAGWTNEAHLLEGDRTSIEEIEGILAAQDKRMVVASGEGGIIGCVTVTDLGGGHCYMGMLCVDPALQAGGLGRQLIAAAEEEAVRSFGGRAMEMTVVDARPELIAYYERRGYARTGETRPFPLPIDVPFRMVVLARALPAA